jgi:branched-subunit amino acid ABC-type transport system permease component
MDPAFIVIQSLSGLASASSLFIIASGLTIVFGVTRIVNFAHGSLYMLGAYLAYALTARWGSLTLAILAGVALAIIGEPSQRQRSAELVSLLPTRGKFSKQE